jgi:hypothetical protein
VARRSAKGAASNGTRVSARIEEIDNGEGADGEADGVNDGEVERTRRGTGTDRSGREAGGI